jgi:hypothetical protein
LEGNKILKKILIIIFTFILLSFIVISDNFDTLIFPVSISGNTDTNEDGPMFSVHNDSICITNITTYFGVTKSPCNLYNGTNIATSLVESVIPSSNFASFTCNDLNNFNNGDIFYILCGDGSSKNSRYTNLLVGDQNNSYISSNAKGYSNNAGTIIFSGNRNFNIESVGVKQILTEPVVINSLNISNSLPIDLYSTTETT